MVLKVKRVHHDAMLPVRGSDGAAGYDLFSVDSHMIMPGHRAIVATGLTFELPAGVYGRIAPRSGLAVKNGLHVGAGVVDPDYTGEVKVVLFNHDKNPFMVKPGYRIAQLILEKYEIHEIDEVEMVTVTERGEGGFGSTGV